MHPTTGARSPDKAVVLLTGIIVGVVVIAVLYWAQRVLIPIALAVLIAFLLNPIVIRIHRWGLPRVVSVIAVTALSLALVLGFGWLVVSQLTSLAEDLPNYTQNIKRKIQNVAEMSENSAWSQMETMMRDLGLLSTAPKSRDPSEVLPNPVAAPRPPLAVVIEPTEPAWVRMLPNVFGPATELLGQIGLVVVLVIFVMLAREDLRNRFIRLVGHGRLTITTKAVDDASQRLSKFLLAQLTLNIAFGICVTIGLALIGVPFALLWGFLGGMLRYVPYLGSPLAALFPLLLSVAQSDSWLQPGLVIGLIVGLELLAANVFEPWLFGHSIGVSAVALLISAAFWAFLWGPIGLVLSCPLTVCLVVLGKYVPQLEFLIVLLGDQPALDEDHTYYQRLSARDEDEATDIALQYVKYHPVDEVYDALLIPALTYARRDLSRRGLDQDDVQFVQDSTRKTLEEIRDARSERQTVTNASAPLNESLPREKVLILGIPVRDESDEIALEMLRQLLDGEACELSIVSNDVLTSELLTKIEQETPTAVCISSVPPGGMSRARILYKRLKARFPDLHILIGRWGRSESEDDHERTIPEGTSDQMQTSLRAARDDLVAWLPALAEKSEEFHNGSKPAATCATKREVEAIEDELTHVASGVT